jgi:hypothetical protein
MGQPSLQDVNDFVETAHHEGNDDGSVCPFLPDLLMGIHLAAPEITGAGFINFYGNFDIFSEGNRILPLSFSIRSTCAGM